MSAEPMPAVPADALHVTVIIPVFNDPDGARACLAALRQQTYPADHFDVVLVDNGSHPALTLPDRLPFRSRVERCVTPGSYAARNAGALVAAGEVLAFTDADCLPDPNWLESGVRTLLAGQGAHVVGGDVQVTQPSIRTGTALYQYASGFQQRENIEHKGFTATANLFCLAQQFAAVGPFDERLLSGADRDWSWRAGTHGLRVVFEPGARVHTPPRTTLPSAIRQARRVTAGRRDLVEHGLAHRGSEALLPHRSAAGRLKWILSQSQFTWWERCRILCAALVIKAATLVERVRLHFGTDAERR
jgi:cellulose synthase/poly-beta-1,6-N-acetylglucosamine synthase-like glycosyltransferase